MTQKYILHPFNNYTYIIIIIGTFDCFVYNVIEETRINKLRSISTLKKTFNRRETTRKST